jgi:prepilin-type N-terminal cleavage/methylation domain-containing protein
MSKVEYPAKQAGFTLIEVLVAVAVTLIIMGAVFGLLMGGQDSFDREHEVVDMLTSTRSGVQMLDRDLSMAGYRTPPPSSILWNDGGGIQPDEVTIVYADPNVAIGRPLQCGGAGAGGGGGACGTIGQSSTLYLEVESLDPAPANAADAYQQGMVLMAVETQDCNGDGLVGLYPFHVTQPPTVTSANGQSTLNVNHNPGTLGSDLNPPGGFNDQVREDCAVVGRFHVITYRVSPPPPVGNPTLERRDLTEGTEWIPVSHNVENLQVRYGIGEDANLVDAPAITPLDDPATWINRVGFTITGRSESVNLKGASEGVFAAEDTYIRKSISSQVALRNVVAATANRVAMLP